MNRKYGNSYFTWSIAIGALVAIGSFIARAKGLYAEYWYTDIILHTLSGVMFGFFWLWVVRRTAFSSKWLLYFTVIMAAVFGSFLWEVWELYGSRIMPEKAEYYIPELADSISDIVCGIIGAAIASLSDSLNHS